MNFKNKINDSKDKYLDHYIECGRCLYCNSMNVDFYSTVSIFGTLDLVIKCYDCDVNVRKICILFENFFNDFLQNFDLTVFIYIWKIMNIYEKKFESDKNIGLPFCPKRNQRDIQDFLFQYPTITHIMKLEKLNGSKKC